MDYLILRIICLEIGRYNFDAGVVLGTLFTPLDLQRVEVLTQCERYW